MDQFKDVTIGAFTYRIDRVSARDGAFLAQKFLSKTWDADKPTYDLCQKIVLSKISRYAEGGVLGNVILKPDGSFLHSDLETDIVTIGGLTAVGMNFNISPFLHALNEGGLLHQIFQDMGAASNQSLTKP